MLNSLTVFRSCIDDAGDLITDLSRLSPADWLAHAEFKRLVMWVGRFRDIRPSRRDDPYYRNVPEGFL